MNIFTKCPLYDKHYFVKVFKGNYLNFVVNIYEFKLPSSIKGTVFTYCSIRESLCE